ncbi:MAG: thiamine phosphate synthase [Polaribacter sp.]|uniref:thiamine phosphate synthase n=1 Tax=Polaribacter sp. TaxID=1920175 RepID=UPI003264B576
MVIPKLHYISQGKSAKEHIENIQKACSSGSELVQLNLKNVSKEEYLKFAKQAKEITEHFQTRLIVNEFFKIAKVIKADGVYFNKTDFCPSSVRANLFTWQIIGAAANTLQECKTLLTNRVDYISLQPFINLENQPKEIIPLGLNEFIAIIDALKTETPIIGFGGITTKDVNAILNTGISGIGVSTEITNDFNLIRTFNKLLKASSTEEQRHSF